MTGVADCRIALVLAGGNALGAYQAGVYQALHRGGLSLDWIVGTSIGAANGAIVAGNAPRTGWRRYAPSGDPMAGLARFIIAKALRHGGAAGGGAVDPAGRACGHVRAVGTGLATGSAPGLVRYDALGADAGPADRFRPAE